jgi:hypothetical protein
MSYVVGMFGHFFKGVQRNLKRVVDTTYADSFSLGPDSVWGDEISHTLGDIAANMVNGDPQETAIKDAGDRIHGYLSRWMDRNYNPRCVMRDIDEVEEQMGNGRQYQVQSQSTSYRVEAFRNAWDRLFKQLRDFWGVCETKSITQNQV